MRKAILLAVILALVSIVALVLLMLNGSSGKGTDHHGGIDLMLSYDNFSLIGGWGPSLSYPIAEIYTPHSSLFVSTFLWNIKSAKGIVNMTFHSSYLNVSVKLSHVVKIQDDINVDGYPTLMYGKEGWFPFYASTMTLPQLKLPPLKLSSLPTFYSKVDFRVYQVNGTIDDFSYDIWLSQNPNVTYLHYPCIEIMVWMYHEENISNPYFIKEGNITVQAIINGSETNVAFTVYVLPHTGSSNGWVGVYYVSSKDLEGDVSLPLSYFIITSFTFIDKVFPSLSPSQYYLDAMQLGMEFNDKNGYVNLGYILYYWYLYCY